MEILNQLIIVFSEYGYIAVFAVLVACGFGVPVPEDVALVAGGVICGLSLSTDYSLNVHYMLLISLIGVLLGDSTMFILGRKLGPRITRVPGLKHIITPNTYAQIQEKASRYGVRILFIARFLPGLRAPIFVTAGISHKVSLWKFLLLDGSAALISVPVWVYVGYLFAYDLDEVIEKVRQFEVAILIILGILIVLFIGFKLFRKKSNKKNIS